MGSRDSKRLVRKVLCNKWEIGSSFALARMSGAALIPIVCLKQHKEQVCLTLENPRVVGGWRRDERASDQQIGQVVGVLYP